MTQEPRALIDRLAQYDPHGAMVVSLYLDLRPNQNGRDQWQVFAKKALREQSAAVAGTAEAKAQLNRDIERTVSYLDAEVQPSANGLALFSCSGGDGLFEAAQLNAAFDQSRLVIDSTPHLYPLAQLLDDYTRYATVVVDSQTARIFVCAAGTVDHTEVVENPAKIKKISVGGWSQPRYQRHVDELRQAHFKEVVAVLDTIVKQEGVKGIIFGGDQVALPRLREELPPHLAALVVDEQAIDIRTPAHEVVQATLEVARRKDAEDDRALVERVLAGYRSGGLGVAGLEPTKQALELGQVDRLLLTGRPAAADGTPVRASGETPAEAERAPLVGAKGIDEETANMLIAMAARTAADIAVIQDPLLLEPVGGVAALLRFKL